MGATGTASLMMPNTVRKSRTLRAMGPITWKSAASGGKPQRRGTRPSPGLRAATPACPAGRRSEPPASVASAMGPMPEPTAATAPPLEPPGCRSGAQGLPVDPKTRLSVKPESESSGVLVLPKITVPAARRRATGMSSRGAM